MKFMIKLPMLALLCFTAIEIALPSQALAGSQGVTPTGDSSEVGAGDNFAPVGSGDLVPSANATVDTIEASPDIAAEIVAVVTSAATTLEVAISQGQSITVPSVIPGQPDLPLSESAAATVVAALTTPPGTDAGIDAAIALAEQISAEANIVDSSVSIDVTTLAAAVSALAADPANLPDAIEAINALINSLSRAEMEALAKSASFAAISEVLEGANAVIPDIT
ncbi:MAG: hypothetical protein AAGC93_09415 [Cyanobacteria bacterium P01_F01_bin.53]